MRQSKQLAFDVPSRPITDDLIGDTIRLIADARNSDEGGLAGRAASWEGLCDIHRRFGEMLPDELLWVEDPQTGERVRMEPGVLRRRDVIAGDHVAISPGAVPRFLDRFEQVYSHLGKAQTICSAADCVPRGTGQPLVAEPVSGCLSFRLTGCPLLGSDGIGNRPGIADRSMADLHRLVIRPPPRVPEQRQSRRYAPCLAHKQKTANR